jgi:hypothetical protein
MNNTNYYCPYCGICNEDAAYYTNQTITCVNCRQAVGSTEWKKAANLTRITVRTRTSEGWQDRVVTLDEITKFEKRNVETYTARGNFKVWNARYFVTVCGETIRCMESDYTTLKNILGKAFQATKTTQIAAKETKNGYVDRRATDWLHLRKV